MVAPKKEKILWIFYLISKEKAYSFKALFASIYIIPQKKVIRLWGEAAIFKKSQQVRILPMNVTYARQKTEPPEFQELRH